MAEKKMNVYVQGKQLMAMGKCASRDESRRVLMGVRVECDYNDHWRMASTDSYALLVMDNGLVGEGEFAFTLPPEALTGIKASDTVFMEYDAEKDEVHVTRHLARNKGMTESTVKCIEGKYPNYKNLMPDDSIPLACYRPALYVKGALVGNVLKAIEQALGSDAEVEVATQEGHDPGKPKAAMVYAKDENVRIRGLVMPLRYTGKSEFLAKPRPVGKAEERNRELRDELKAAKANADMWKDMYGKLEAKQGEVVEQGGDAVKLAEELEKVKAERDKFAEKFRVEKAKRVEEKGAKVDGKRVKELEAELAEAKAAIADAAGKLKETRKELDEVWKENAHLKAAKPKEVPPAPKAPEPVEATAAAVSLSFMDMDAEGAERCMEVIREAVRPGIEDGTVSVRWKGKTLAPIRVEGATKPFQDELDGLGLRWAGKSKYWYLSPTMPKTA